MNPVQQVLAQQESGSAQGQGFGQFFVQGQQAGLARRRLDLEERQEKRAQTQQDMLLPLQAQMMKEQVTNLGIAATHNALKLKIDTLANTAVPEVDALTLFFMQSPDGFMNKEGGARMDVLRRHNPDAFAKGAPGDVLYNKVMGTYIKEFESLKQRKMIEDMMAKLQPGTRVTIGENGMTIDKDASKSAAAPGTLSTLGKEAADLAALEGRAPNAEDFAKAQASRDTRNNMTTEVVTGSDGTTTTRIIKGGTGQQQQGGLPTAVANEQEKARLATIASAQEVRKIMGTIQDNPNAWGMRGIGMDLFETAKGVLDPDAPAPNKDAINKAELFFTQVADSFKVDTGQMSNYERQKLDKAAALTDWKGNRRSMTDKAMNLLDAVTAKHLRTSKALGKAPDDSVLRSVKAKDLKVMRDNKLMSLLDFERWYKLQQETE